MNVGLCAQVGFIASFVVFSQFGCCHYPKAQVVHLTGHKPDVPTITVVAYGDTRTGPWGLGDNKKQALHGKVVDDIFANNSSIDAVVFTGRSNDQLSVMEESLLALLSHAVRSLSQGQYTVLSILGKS